MTRLASVCQRVTLAHETLAARPATQREVRRVRPLPGPVRLGCHAQCALQRAFVRGVKDRCHGAGHAAAEVDRVRAELCDAGTEPVLAGASWTLPGLLGVYCDGHPTAYSFGPALGDRRSQYDFWRPNPVWDPGTFRGRTFVLVGDVSPAVFKAFAAVDVPRVVRYCEGGQPVAVWTVTVCRGFRGFGPIDELLTGQRY